MLPGSYLAAAFLLALVPGWTYLRLRARRDPALPRTGLDQTLEVVAVGLMTTGLALALWALVPSSSTHLADVTKLARSGGAKYAETHVRRVVASLLVVLVLAEVLAYLLFRILHRGKKQEFVRETVWAGALGKRPLGEPWMGVEMRDGRLVEGWLLAYPTGDEHEHRDLALQSTPTHPIRVTKPGEAAALFPHVDRLILREDDIANITMKIEARPPSNLSASQEQWQRLVDWLYLKMSVRPRRGLS